MQKPESMTNPIKEFPVSSALMLGYGFKNIGYAIIDTPDTVDGIFYFRVCDGDDVTTFGKKLEKANMDALVNDFDYITEDLNFIMLRRYKSSADE